MEKKNTIKTSLWLTPSKKDTVFYQRAIQKLSKRFDTPVFEPHITLCSIDEWTEERKTTFENFIKNKQKLKLRLNGLATLGTFFQCFYLKMAANERFIFLSRNIHTILNVEKSGIIPHLSLLYGNLDQEQIQDLMKEYQTYFNRRVIFDRIKIVKTGMDIENWSVEESYQLN